MVNYILIIWRIVFGFTIIISCKLTVNEYRRLKKELYYLYEYDEKKVRKYPLFKNKIVIDCNGIKKSIRVQGKKYLFNGNWYGIEEPFFLDVCGTQKRYSISKRNIKTENRILKNISYNSFKKLAVSITIFMITMSISISIVNKYNSVSTKNEQMATPHQEYFYEKRMEESYDDFQYLERGIDVSEFQKEIDWKMVSKSEIDFVMIRLGYRGTETGEIVEDKYSEYNIASALNEGISVGVYFVSQAINKDEVIEEIEYISDIISVYQITYPVAISWKPVDSGPSRADYVPGNKVIELLNYSCSILSEKGYNPLVFIEDENYNLLENYDLLDYNIWIDQHGENLTIAREKCVMWQHGYTNISGIKGEVGADVYINPTVP